MEEKKTARKLFQCVAFGKIEDGPLSQVNSAPLAQAFRKEPNTMEALDLTPVKGHVPFSHDISGVKIPQQFCSTYNLETVLSATSPVDHKTKPTIQCAVVAGSMDRLDARSFSRSTSLDMLSLDLSNNQGTRFTDDLVHISNSDTKQKHATLQPSAVCHGYEIQDPKYLNDISLNDLVTKTCNLNSKNKLVTKTDMSNLQSDIACTKSDSNSKNYSPQGKCEDGDTRECSLPSVSQAERDILIGTSGENVSYESAGASDNSINVCKKKSNNPVDEFNEVTNSLLNATSSDNNGHCEKEFMYCNDIRNENFATAFKKDDDVCYLDRTNEILYLPRSNHLNSSTLQEKVNENDKSSDSTLNNLSKESLEYSIAPVQKTCKSPTSNSNNEDVRKRSHENNLNDSFINMMANMTVTDKNSSSNSEAQYPSGGDDSHWSTSLKSCSIDSKGITMNFQRVIEVGNCVQQSVSVHKETVEDEKCNKEANVCKKISGERIETEINSSVDIRDVNHTSVETNIDRAAIKDCVINSNENNSDISLLCTKNLMLFLEKPFICEKSDANHKNFVNHPMQIDDQCPATNLQHTSVYDCQSESPFISAHCSTEIENAPGEALCEGHSNPNDGSQNLNEVPNNVTELVKLTSIAKEPVDVCEVEFITTVSSNNIYTENIRCNGGNENNLANAEDRTILTALSTVTNDSHFFLEEKSLICDSHSVEPIKNSKGKSLLGKAYKGDSALIAYDASVGPYNYGPVVQESNSGLTVFRPVSQSETPVKFETDSAADNEQLMKSESAIRDHICCSNNNETNLLPTNVFSNEANVSHDSELLAHSSFLKASATNKALMTYRDKDFKSSRNTVHTQDTSIKDVNVTGYATSNAIMTCQEEGCKMSQNILHNQDARARKVNITGYDFFTHDEVGDLYGKQSLQSLTEVKCQLIFDDRGEDMNVGDDVAFSSGLANLINENTSVSVSHSIRKVNTSSTSEISDSGNNLSHCSISSNTKDLMICRRLCYSSQIDSEETTSDIHLNTSFGGSKKTYSPASPYVSDNNITQEVLNIKTPECISDKITMRTDSNSNLIPQNRTVLMRKTVTIKRERRNERLQTPPKLNVRIFVLNLANFL